LDRRGAAVDSSNLGSMTSTFGNTTVFVLLMDSFSRWVHYLYHTEQR
jgi:hypothetical protein